MAYCAIRAPGPEPGEPQCTEDPGGLDWQVFAVRLEAAVCVCAGSAQYTPQQQPAADRLLAARAREDASYEEWHDKQQRQTHMKVLCDGLPYLIVWLCVWNHTGIVDVLMSISVVFAYLQLVIICCFSHRFRGPSLGWHMRRGKRTPRQHCKRVCRTRCFHLATTAARWCGSSRMHTWRGWLSSLAFLRSGGRCCLASHSWASYMGLWAGMGSGMMWMGCTAWLRWVV